MKFLRYLGDLIFYFLYHLLSIYFKFHIFLFRIDNKDEYKMYIIYKLPNLKFWAAYDGELPEYELGKKLQLNSIKDFKFELNERE